MFSFLDCVGKCPFDVTGAAHTRTEKLFCMTILATFRDSVLLVMSFFEHRLNAEDLVVRTWRTVYPPENLKCTRMRWYRQISVNCELKRMAKTPQWRDV